MDTTLGYFGDKRLQASGALLMERLLAVGQSGVSVRKLGGSRAGELRLGHLLHSPKVKTATMIETAFTRTAARVAGRSILVAQDTTSLRDDGTRHSHQLHAAIALDAETGALIGLVHASFHRRAGGQKANCGKRLFADKESRRWLDAVQASGRLAEAGAAGITAVGDAECDIYDVFALRPASVAMVVRAHHDRVLEDGTRLFGTTDDLAEWGRETIELPANPGRAARTATLALKAVPVTISRPKRNTAAETAALPPELRLWLVEAREVDVPAGATPAHWRLLTTHRVTTLAEARRITGLYRQRWTIEQLFRTMKTKGFDIEAVRVVEPKPFETLTAAVLIAAVQVLQMVRERDGAAKRPQSDVFEAEDQPVLEALCGQLQGKTERQKNPHPTGSLAYAAWVCARLGGWTGYYGSPGPVVILGGMLRFQAIKDGWKLREIGRIS